MVACCRKQNRGESIHQLHRYGRYGGFSIDPGRNGNIRAEPQQILPVHKAEAAVLGVYPSYGGAAFGSVRLVV